MYSRNITKFSNYFGVRAEINAGTINDLFNANSECELWIPMMSANHEMQIMNPNDECR